MPKRVFFAMPLERSIPYEGVNAWAAICFRLGGQPTPGVRYERLETGYQSVDSNRNYLTFRFWEQSKQPEDTLVMLDDDHAHPVDLVERLQAHHRPVVGALAFKRRAPYQPVAYFRDPQDGVVKVPKQLPASGLYQVQRVGTGAIAIQRRVLEQLAQCGFYWPWFRFQYQDWALYRGGEDVHFSECCEKARVPIYVDMGLRTPHLDTEPRGESAWQAWLAEHPDSVWNGTSIAKELMEAVPEQYRVK